MQTKNSPFSVDLVTLHKKISIENTAREKAIAKNKRKQEKKLEKVRENLVYQAMNQFPDTEELKRKYIKFLADLQQRKQGLADLQKTERSTNKNENATVNENINENINDIENDE